MTRLDRRQFLAGVIAAPVVVLMPAGIGPATEIGTAELSGALVPPDVFREALRILYENMVWVHRGQERPFSQLVGPVTFKRPTPFPR